MLRARAIVILLWIHYLKRRTYRQRQSVVSCRVSHVPRYYPFGIINCSLIHRLLFFFRADNLKTEASKTRYGAKGENASCNRPMKITVFYIYLKYSYIFVTAVDVILKKKKINVTDRSLGRLISHLRLQTALSIGKRLML